MGYEFFALPVPPGADIEEAGEALLARLARGERPEGRRAGAVGSAAETRDRERAAGGGSPSAPDEPAPPSAGAMRQIDDLAERLMAADPDLLRMPADAAAAGVELRARSGLVVTLAERWARFLVPWAHQGDAAAEAFRQLFRALGVVARERAWRVYDPQEAAGVPLDDAGCASTLEVYLTVMDQLRPGGPRRGP